MKSKPVPNIRNRYLLLGDLILIVLSVMGSYALRFELGNLFFFYLPSAYWMAGAALIIKPLVYYFFGMYRRMWIYASTREVVLIVSAVATSSVILSAVMVALASLRLFIGFPRPVLVFDFFLSVVLAGGLRFVLRLLAENRVNQVLYSGLDRRRTQKVLIVGAGDAGALVVRELQKNPQLYLTPVGFLDDNPSKLKQQIYGVPVIGTLSDLSKVIDQTGADQVIIAIPSAPGRVVRLVAEACRPKGIPFRTMPGIYELLGGKVSVSRLREVDISDLLRREPAHIEEELVGATLGGRVVLVTGAGGSIGRELCRQIARWGPSELIVLGHGENSIFETMLELRENFSLLLVRPVIADVRDYPRIRSIFNRHRPDIVFHAAAHKHVPLMESNVEEAVTNNILGTMNVVSAALEADVNRLVMISTDKAIRPANVMGATKRVAEMIVLDAADRSGRAYSVVRFGNVLGSRGSVVPLFKSQIARGGPVTVTHPEMRRYFMTIPEAVHLVLQVAAMGKGGETFMLNMGEQVRILDLAEDLIRLSGLEPGKDIEIVFTGIRPGEKLSEDLWDEGNLYQKTSHPDIFKIEGQVQDMDSEALHSMVEELVRLAREGESQAIITLLDELIPFASIRRTPPPELTAIE
ncbi:MAG TPA: polysaccharide biosynthesis protein [Anaerolinea thermolimosa]|uniref:Polysaccharide biosynthesis protein n=1 Tax=Anaerolinea thermolimosa TaxID=229919 RepID=A0A3D1JG29_9CHLR|nr:nucleoside-diphosphate sugar epimerase/dehydratase [Anaerolinea thermolimosa]GAP06948.1 predicted nucleoside-diphosphate sugar epimerases [Anaerolinea thermolimosa]HCE17541.1 polysaccharide biosynthesis protein [Anaerolinea thermolimosa]